jgi:ribonuclease R
MADKIGDEFDGYITSVTSFGLFVELIEHYVDGLVHISSMADDYYRFMERAHLLRGEHTHRVYRIGDKVRVQVVRVDQTRRQIDLGLVEVLDRLRASERNRGPRVSKAEGKESGKGRGERNEGKGKAAQRPGKRERAVTKAVKKHR